MDKPQINPPKWAKRLLRWYCKSKSLEIIEGDIYELFEKRLTTDPKNAKRKFGWDVLRFFRIKYIKGLGDINSLNNTTMFKNYFKISIRILYKQGFYSLINIGGLATGLSACLLIVMYISNEMSYDKFHANSERIYRIGAFTPARLAIQAKLDLPEIEETTRIRGPYSQTFNIDGKIFKEPMGFNADSTFNNIFSVEFIEGNPSESLNQPNSIVLTQSLAVKFFGFEPALGRLIKADGELLKITGVVADPPKNTHFNYKFIGSFPHESWVTVGNWTGNNFYTYAKISKGSDPKVVETKLTAFAAKYVGPELVEFTGHSSYEEYLADGRRAVTFPVLPMTDLHLYYPRLSLSSGGSIDNVYIFSAVALFILVIACINFMNLSTARSAMRSKEVGVRKVLGSLKSQLVKQFLVESMMVSVLSMFLALGFAALALNGFNSLSNRSFDYQDLFRGVVMLQLLGLVIFVGLLAGSYPAFILSSFKPIRALKGEVQNGGRGSAFFRQGLVAFQFAISIFLIISTVVVFRQLNFLSDQKLGFDSEQILIVKNANVLEDKAEVLKDQLAKIPSIENMAMSKDFLSERVSDWGYETVEENSRDYSFINMFATDDFLNTMGLELLEGRNFTNELVTDTANILINEAAKKWLGWDDVLGRKLSRGDGEDYSIVGVINDFNFSSLKNEIEPMVIRLMGDDGRVEADWYAGNYIYLRINGNYKETVLAVEELWKNTVEDEPFEYAYLDEAFNALYREEERFGKLFTTSSVLAIIIASLGLFSLAAFTLERRFKEIAVRKVLGASIQSITLMILKTFTRLVLAGAVVAIPISYLLMKSWLKDYAYQINLNNPLIWILPALFVVLIAWLTVGFQSVKSALANPIKALRSE